MSDPELVQDILAATMTALTGLMELHNKLAGLRHAIESIQDDLKLAGS